MKKAIRHITRHHLKRFNKGLDQYQRTGKQAVMHALRVDMKAIRSVCFLLEAAGKGRSPHQLHQRIRKLFAQAGRIREWQLEAQWLRQHHYVQMLRFHHYPLSIGDANARFLRQARKQRHFIRQWPKRFDQETRSLPVAAIRTYIRGLLSRILHSLQVSLPTTEWHRLRKDCKRLLHAGQWLSRQQSMSLVVSCFVRDIGELQAGIGQWHDLQVMQERFQADRADGSVPEAARTEWNRALQQLQKAITLAEAEVQQKLSVMHDRWIARSLS